MINSFKHFFDKYGQNFFLIITFLEFLIFGLYFVFNINYGISPDEFYHINVSKIYSNSLFIPKNSSDSFMYGDITRMPYLYFWINARLINIIKIDHVRLMRIVSLLYSCGTIYFTYLISKLIINKKYWNVLPSFLIVNTMMFVFLSSSVNYDNLVNLLSVVSLYLLIKFIKFKNIVFLILYLIIINLGILTKFTFLPLMFVELLILIIFIYKKNFNYKKILYYFLSHKFLSSLLVVFILLSFFLYGKNLLLYGKIIVPCDQVMTNEQCMLNPVYERNIGFKKYSIKQVINKEIDVMTPYQYFNSWLLAMIQRTYGVMGHKNLFMNSYVSNLYIFIYFISFVLIFRNWNRKKYLENILIYIFLFYLMILLIFQNYKSYLETNLFVLALQGRYLFPVLSIIYITIVNSIKESRNLKMKVLFTVFVLLLFVFGCFPYFFKNVPTDWFIY